MQFHSIHVQYCDITRFTLHHSRHYKVSQSVPFFIHCKTITILLRIRVRGHFAMSITKNHESHYATALDNPLLQTWFDDTRQSKNTPNNSWSCMSQRPVKIWVWKSCRFSEKDPLTKELRDDSNFVLSFQLGSCLHW